MTSTTALVPATGPSAATLIRTDPIDAHTVGDVVKKYARLANVKKHVTPHVWRRTCATHLVKSEANLRHVQDILGHRSLNPTERYLRLTITDQKETHRKFHPREQHNNR
jgi:integrase/recombinase XerD